jgi:outer membrane protein
MKSLCSYTSVSVFLFLLMMSCKQAPAPASTAAPTGGTSTIVYIDIDSLISKYDLYKERKTELEGQSKTAEQALAGKIEAFQRRVGKFQQELAQIQQNANNIAPVELRKIEEKYGMQQQNLAREEESLMKQRDNAAMDLEKKLQETQKDIQKKIDEYLVKIAEEKGYDYVLMKGAGGSVMFGKSSLDITNETITKLNEEYASSKK